MTFKCVRLYCLHHTNCTNTRMHTTYYRRYGVRVSLVVQLVAPPYHRHRTRIYFIQRTSAVRIIILRVAFVCIVMFVWL